MDIELVDSLQLVGEQPACIKATFTGVSEGSYISVSDERGKVFLFEQSNRPAIFVEVIHTKAGKIRGNHVHANCDETLNVVSGKAVIYLLCSHGKHVYRRVLNVGETVISHKGTPHAFVALQDSEYVVLFEHDPRDDRDRVSILVF